MEGSLPLYIVLIVQAVLTLVILLFVNLSSRGFFQQGRFSGIKAKSKLEQRLILETLSSLSQVSSYQQTALMLGNLASEKSGYPERLFWIRTEAGFQVLDKQQTVSAEGVLLTTSHPLIDWILKNQTPTTLGGYLLHFAAEKELEKLLQPFLQGMMIPCADGGVLEGFILLGGSQDLREHRTEQFYSLFGAVAAISLRKARNDEISEALQRRQQRVENLARLGELAAGLAHEIRNPLTFVKSSTQHLVKTHGLAESEPELVEGLVEEIDRINATITDLLELGKIDTEAFSVVEMKSLLRRVVTVTELQAESQNIRLIMKSEGELPVLGDRDALHRMLLNLVINAFNATPAGGTIQLEGRRHKNTVELLISDTGSGIPEEIRERIFDPFFTTRDSGTGLGLSICHNTAKVHGGELELADPEPGYSTALKVRLPAYREKKT